MALKQRIALVTGASQGLGLETCRQLAAAGLRVILTSRDEAAGRAAVADLAKAGTSVEYCRLDIADADSVAAAANWLRDGSLLIDVLVNNAAIALNGFNADVARRTIGTNFFGTLHVTDGLAPFIPDGGTIVMVSSGAGELSGFSSSIRAKLSDPHLTREGLIRLMHGFVSDVAGGRHEANGWPSSAYNTSKAGLNALTRIMSAELARRHIRVNAVCPGWVRTRMGGRSATRSLDKGGASIVWAALLEDDTTGGFFRDGRRIAW